MTRKLDTEVRREQIVRAALDVVAARGLPGLSIGAVARRIGLVPSAIYRHFDSKDSMLDAVLQHIGERLAASADAAAAKHAHSLSRLHDLLGRHLHLVGQSAAIPRLVFSEEVYGRRTGRRRRLFAIVSLYLDKVAAMVAEGQQRGEIRADADAKTVAIMFLGLVQPAAILWHMSDRKLDVPGHAERAWRMFADAVAA